MASSCCPAMGASLYLSAFVWQQTTATFQQIKTVDISFFARVT